MTRQKSGNGTDPEHDLPLFNHPDPITEKAIIQVEKNAKQIFKDGVMDLIYEAAKENQYLTTKAVHDKIVLDEDLMKLNQNMSVLGPLMRVAKKNGWIIILAGQTVESQRPAAHRHPERVWKSQIYIQK